jgi:hypothetical protein
MLSEPQVSLLLTWAVIGVAALVALYVAADMRAAYRSADPREHQAAAATIGQLLMAGWVVTGLVTAVGVWRGHVGLAVGAASLFWLVTAGSARFAASSRRWEERHAPHVRP